ncbi:MAG: PSD1 and planctomycete cytochrome C domain-containing protein [Chthoniobacter sp.]|uniref:PSD1 and planctomycete cytochrome C domain-containing protein n=1 Tax=Chthoniobacter sp. TaxID=2510640 RepID=UPI0032A5FAE6
MKICLRSLLAITLAACASRGALLATPPSAEQTDFFEKQVRPLLTERCYECHSAEKKTKGGLALDTRESTLKGGDTGPALVAGDPEKSLLIEAVRYGNHDLQMPPKRRLSDTEVKTLETWVKMGAPDPREAVVAKQGRVIDINEGRKFWSFQPLARVEPPADPKVASPIDAFLQAKLAEKGLSPAPPADKRTLLRRATFDLIGLPPTPEEVDAFVADTSPEAFDHVVERLLASPHYGERWGRHWLDVARYADSNGMDENVAFGNAWRYRDYVVRAFNDDKPYDQFLIEQIAGDLLPSSEDTLAATGFLSLGARVLAEPDMQKLEMDIIDEQIDTVGKAFLGMTLGCVRCHDHKFDPIKQEDYYAMAAIFRSTRSLSTEKMGAIKFWYEHSLATPEQLAEKKKYDETVKAKKAEITAVSTKARAEVKAKVQVRVADYLAAAALLPAEAKQADAEPVAKETKLDTGILLTCRRYLDQHSDNPVFAPWRELASKKDVDGIRQHYEPIFAEALAAKKGPVYDALADAKGILALPVKDADILDATTLAQIAAMTMAMADFEAKGPDLPAIMTVADDKIVPTLAVHLRGSYLTLGKPVERGFPEVMRTSFTQPILPAKHSGRLELARWMASSEHPLTARVIVNRVWRWHFGQGIVTSTDNFGFLGSKPSHPELLDWLARTFIESGWSIKDLHRLIMKSAAYQQASNVSFSPSDKVDPRIVDPENHLLWRANIQRLEAEEIRDAMLFTSGWLDLQIGGKTIPLHNREFVFNHTSKDATTYESPRRALYLPIIRNHLYDMLEQFDYPDPTMPTGSRNSTVIAPQALIMMNAPVVMRSSTRLAGKLASLPDDEQRLQQVYTMLYGRPPLEHEKTDALAFVRDLSATEQPSRAWALLCQTLMAANEFIYLR